MPLPIKYFPLALSEAEQLAKHIALDSMKAAERFSSAIAQTCRQLAEMPELGGLCQFEKPGTESIRKWAVRGFPNHLIFYQIANDRIEVIRILHGSRDYNSLFEE